MDFAYLESFAAGDRDVVAEVLTLFVEQAGLWRVQLASPDEGWRDVIHTIKGASRGIGAVALGDICERVEREGEASVPDVDAAVEATVTAIRGYLGR